VTVSAPRRRLDAEQRRLQLIETGATLSRSLPADQVTPEAVAAAAGVSKGLLFHYFPTRSDLQAAIVSHVVAELLDRLAPDPDLLMSDQLRQGLEVFVEFIDDHRVTYASFARGVGSSERLRAVYDDTRNTIVSLIAARLGLAEPTGVVRLAIRGWVAMAEEIILDWMATDDVARSEMIELLTTSAWALLATDAVPAVARSSAGNGASVDANS